MKSRRYVLSAERHRSKACDLELFPDNQFIPDCGPAERWQHTGRLLEIADDAGSVVSRVSEECVLDTLHLQGHLTARQLTAALRLRRDYMRADLAAHLVGSYNPARVSSSYYVGCDDRSDQQEEAYQSWRSAVVAVGELLSDVVVTVACHDVMPSEAQILSLQIGLIRLARYFRIPDLGENVDQTATRQVGVGRSRISEVGCGDARGRRLH